MILLDAKASTTEEPDAGKLHVRVRAGAPGNRRSYRKRVRPLTAEEIVL
jgi:hypothetical protein